MSTRPPTPDASAPSTPAGGSLDPSDWEAFRVVAHRVVDEAINYQRDVRQRPVWQPVPEAARAALRQPLPTAAGDLDQAFDEVSRHIQPYPYGNIHPRFWGWVNGAGTPLAMLADLVAAAMNGV